MSACFQLPQSEADEEIAALADSWVLTRRERREIQCWAPDLSIRTAKCRALWLGVAYVAAKIADGRVLPEEWRAEARLEASAMVLGEDLEAIEAAATDIYAAAEHGGYEHARALASWDEPIDDGTLTLGDVTPARPENDEAEDAQIDLAYFDALSEECIEQVRVLASPQQRKILDLALSGAFASYRAIGVHLGMKNPLQAVVQMERLVAKAHDHFERIVQDAA